MEDAHILRYGSTETMSGFFGVFDGHWGARCARFCMQNFHSTFIQHVTNKDGEYMKDSADMTQAMKKSFLEIDEVGLERV